GLDWRTARYLVEAGPQMLLTLGAGGMRPREAVALLGTLGPTARERVLLGAGSETGIAPLAVPRTCELLLARGMPDAHVREMALGRLRRLCAVG
ncbi:MAG: hypothetical protein JJU35_15350, partial [Balneolales bacterium]|nr:hypothetical protein [Balneolales bacterium]